MRDIKPRMSELNATLSWTDDEISTLIWHWKSNEFLYNPKQRDYRNKSLKSQTLQAITEHLNGKTVENVLEKMHSLRCQFNNEKKKIEDKGYSATKWRFYKEMKFLNAGKRETETEADSATEDDEKQEEPQATENIEPAEKRSRLSVNRRMIPTPNSSSLLALAAINKKYDDASGFGNYVAGELRGINALSLRRKAKREIQDILLKYSEEDEILEYTKQVLNDSNTHDPSSYLQTELRETRSQDQDYN